MDYYWWIVGGIGLLAGIRLISFGSKVKKLLLSRVEKKPLRRVEPEEVPGYLNEIFKGYEEDLRELGFEFSHCSWHEECIYFYHPSVAWFKGYYHAEEECYAFLSVPSFSLRQNPCQCSFESYFSDGSQLLTLDQGRSLEIIGELPQTIVQDVLGRDLRGQFSQHRMKLSELRRDKEPLALGPDEAIRFSTEKNFEYIEGLYKQGVVQKAGEDKYKFTVKSAIHFMREAEKKLRKKQAEKKRHSGDNQVNRIEVPLEAEVEFFDYFIKMNKPQQSGALGKLMILGVSLLLFMVSFRMRFSADMILVLVVVLFIHELGHYLGMYLFGYKDLRIVFLPFLGAATIGKAKDVSTIKKLLVYVLGPAPGIVIGTVIIFLYTVTEQEWMLRFGAFCLILNYLNLLPFAPLDGGRIFELILFVRYPRLKILFYIFSMGVLLLGGVLLKEPILIFISLFLLAGTQAVHVENKARSELKKRLAGVEGPVDEEEIKPMIFDMFKEASFVKLPFNRKCQIAKNILDSGIEQTPGAGMMAICFLMYFGVLILPVFIIIPLIVTRLFLNPG